MRTREAPGGGQEHGDTRSRRKKWLTAVACMAALVVFGTVYALMMPAATLESETYCGETGHTHAEACYESTLSCGLEEGEEHTHDEGCYEETLICDLTEHTHTDECYVDPEETEDVTGTEEAETLSAGTEDEAAALPDGAEVPDGYTGQYTVRDEDNGFTVTVYAPEGVVPEGVTLSAALLSEEDDAYAEAEEALAEDAEEDSGYGFAALDIHFEDADGNEVEPDGDVYVVIDAEGLLPGDADADTVTVQHHGESDGTVTVETVADAAGETDGVVAVTGESVVQAAFTVESFSTFTISWSSGSTTYFRVTVHYVDEDGNEIQGTQTTNIFTNNVSSSGSTYTFSTYAGDISGYTYSGAYYGSLSGSTVTSMTFSQSGGTRTLTFYNESSTVATLTYSYSTRTANVYLVYAESSDASITLVGSNYEYASTHKDLWEVTDTSIATITSGEQSQTVTIAAGTNGTTTVTHKYTSDDSNCNYDNYVGYYYEETFIITVEDGKIEAYVKVYVYVAGTGLSDECLTLLGINADTLDSNGYFPAGEILVSASYFQNKNARMTYNSPLLNDESDWTELLAALEEMDTSTLADQRESEYEGFYDSGKKDYSLNQGNDVGDYLENAAVAYNRNFGSQQTALCRWHYLPSYPGNGSYGFDDQSVNYHLDLYFTTNTIEFVFGNNGITDLDGTTSDTRTYITGSEIQAPTNLYSLIPEGYYFDGFYTDADFNEEWDGIGDPLTEDTTVYIKLSETPVMTITLTKEVSGATVTNQAYTFTIATTNSEVAGKTYTSSNTADINFSASANEGVYTATVTLTATSQNGTDAATIISGLPLGTYTITENTNDVSIDGYIFEDVTYSGGTEGSKNTVTGTETSANFTVAVTNTYEEAVDVTFKKTDSDGSTTLSGAEFQLYYTEDGTNYYYKNSDSGVSWTETQADATLLVSDENGLISIDGLRMDATYYLVETKAPDGYQLLTDTISISWNNGALVVYKGNTPLTDDYIDQDTNTITITNTTGQKLPETGGAGTTLFTISGLLVLAVAAGGGTVMRRRRGREGN